MNIEDLKKKVGDKNIKVVSFDIFDTLLLRPCIEPVDMFRLVAKRCNLPVEFVTVRRKAEQIARSKKPYYNDDITFDDIYDEFINSLGYSKDEADKIKQTELDVELDYLTPRHSLQEVFNEAIKNDKNVIICSDMYHSEEFLTKVLNKNNYHGFSKMYVSSEYKLSKGSKRLFKQIVYDFENKGVKAKEILHIGDNYRADIENSRAEGMQSEYVESVKNKFKRIKFLSTLHGYMTLTNNLNSDNTFLIAYAANIIFDDPYRKFDNNTRFNGELNTLANVLLAPLVFTFVKWMLEDCIERDIDKLCLIYRDGYLPEQIINILKPYYDKVPELTRLRLSRRALRCFEVKKKHGFIFDALHNPVNPDMKISEYLSLRAFLTEESQQREILDKIQCIGYGSLDDAVGPFEKQIELAKTIEPYFIYNSHMAADIVEQYCKDETGSFDSLAIFDIGYSGRIHRLLKDTFEIENICYHIFGYDYLKNQCIDVKSFQYVSSSFTNKSMIIHNAFLEDVISEQAPSVSRIVKNNGRIDFIYDDNFSVNNNMIELQEYILEFCKLFSEKFSKDLTTMSFEGFDFYEVYKQLLNNPHIKDAKMFCNFEFQDNWITGNEISYYQSWYNRKLNNNRNGNIINGDFKDNKIKTKVKHILKTFHLFEPTKKIYLKIKKIKLKKNETNKRILKMNQDMINSINEISLREKDSNDKDNVIILGHMASFDKGTCKYLKKIATKLQNNKFILLSETPNMKIDRINELLEMPIFVVSRVAFSNGFDKDLEVPISSHVKSTLDNNKYLVEISSHLKKQFKYMTKTYADNLVVYFYDYCSTALDQFTPQEVIIWNQFSAMHEVMANICRERKIQTVFMEFGVLPGTFSIDTNGQMGESLISIEYNDFLNKPVSEEEIFNAKNIIKFIKESKLNRNIQPVNNQINEIKDKLQSSRPTILLFGQSDYESGLCPYTQHTKEFHSPIATSSDDSMRIIAKLAEKNNYNIIYKPHPAMRYLNLKSDVPSNVIVVDDVNIHDLIDLANVVVTVLSQSSYETLIRGVPVVMLGYNQLRGKGCTYEAFDYKEIESVLKNAVENGFTEKQKIAFNKHIAQLLKYYLFDDTIKRDVKFGQPIENFAECLKRYIR
ncbi:hypothetical protein [Clostridium sp. ZBS15]|uniref:capsular polysaccharide export protein, LipB/KpsS family n=1 Tax=Clostridium sp. ZBS15 TaxID=2949969 RepID=UPI00207AC586|nr:hypothetical protein [Clostridium sp. ZBS15]